MEKATIRGDSFTKQQRGCKRVQEEKSRERQIGDTDREA